MSLCSGTWEHAKIDRHHPLIFMIEDMAVIYEVSDIRSAEVHPESNARERMFFISVPERNINHVHQLAVEGFHRLAAVNLEIVLRQHHEMNLMEVEFMVLLDRFWIVQSSTDP